MDLHKLKRTAKPLEWADEDRELALGILRTDPLFRRVEDSAVAGLLDCALSAGAECAEELIEEQDCADPLRLSRRMGIRVLFDISRSASAGSFNILSTYTHQPPTITVYENRLRLCREKLMGRGKRNNVFLANLTNICVAHEIYHHIERKSLKFINLQHRITIADLRVVKIQKSLSMLSEVAANAFAMRLMELPMLPSIIHEGFEV